jgi:hypothetical protein
VRRRIVRTILVVTALTLLIFSVTVTWVSASRIDEKARADAQAQAERIATGLTAAFERQSDPRSQSLPTEGDGGLVLERFTSYLRPGEQIEVRTPDGRTLVFGETADGQRVVASSTGLAYQVTVRQAGDDVSSAALRVGAALAGIAFVALLVAWFVAPIVSSRPWVTSLRPPHAWAAATPGPRGSATASRSSTPCPRSSTSRHSASARSCRPSAGSPPTSPTSCAPH